MSQGCIQHGHVFLWVRQHKQSMVLLCTCTVLYKEHNIEDSGQL